MSKKRMVSLIVIVTILVQLMTVSQVMADKLPGAIWSLFEEEVAKENAGDISGLIETRLEIIALFDGWSDSSTQKLDIVTPRYEKIAKGYESLLKYDEAIDILNKYIYYADLQETYGDWDHFAVLWAESKIKNMQLDVKLFVDTDELANSVYYGAMYEPKVGTYFGAAYDKDTRVMSSAGGHSYDWDHVSKFYPKKNSAYLIYLEFETPINTFSHYFEAAKESNTGVELAWNVYETFDDMSLYDSYIEETASYLKALDIPIFLRYGAEMNIQEDMEDHREFVENFQYVVSKVRAIAPNVAMVWSPNEISDSSRKLEDYYPGDAYVDWVGISTYTYYYFGDKKDWGAQQESIDNQYFTGPYANPLSKIAEVVEFVGDRKPIMIAESGVAHYSNMANEDMTEWAKIQLKRQYDYMPLLYPQIKGIFYFNVDMGPTKNNTYALYENDAIYNLYNDLVGDDQYLSNIGDTATSRYAEVGTRRDKSVMVTDSSIDMKTYVVVPGTLEPTIKYYMDGKLLKTTNVLPYDYSIQTASLSEGAHTFIIEVLNEDDIRVQQSTFMMTKSDAGILVEEGVYTPRTFNDVSNEWFANYVLDIAKRNIIVGSDNAFRPNDFISRAEMTSIISKLGGLTEEAPVNYKDVPSDAWYTKYISGSQEFLTAYGSSYYPDRLATREEIIVALVKLKGLSPSEVTSADRSDFIAKFSDVKGVSSANMDYLILAVQYGIVGGYEDGTLKPMDTMKRGEVAKVLYTTFYQ